ncbi:MAG: antibiotic biosynthesis monooxygenase [Balneolaceae bacterium]|nr:antibiotic biosynthesis monooxygenase [Balneolaceae bacterium]
MNKYGLHGALKAKEGKAENLAKILLKAAEMISTAKGCHLYLVSFDSENSDLVWVTEVWDSKEDHDNSLQMDGVRELISTAMPLLDGNPQKGQQLKILGGYGI